MADILPDSHFVENLYQKNQNLFERVLNKLKEFMKNVREYFAHVNPNTKLEAAVLKENTESGMRYLEKIVEAFDKTAEAAVENYQQGTTESTAERKTQYKTRGKYWRPNLKGSEWQLLERRMAEEIGSRENFLDEATKWVYANEKGVQVFALYGIGDGTEATPLYAVGGKQAVSAAADIRKFENGGYRYDGNTETALSWIRSVSRTQGDGGGDIREASRGGSAGTDDALYGGERKGNAGGAAERGSEDQRGVKEKFSLRDSAGRELTEAQQAYFKDSKVRDADGNLLVMYHQTDGTFTVFDTKHKGAGAGDDETPFGIFLKRTPRNIGVRGEKQMELYADIRNPLRVRDRTELVSKLRELSVDYARLKDESAQIDKEYGAKFEEAKNAFKSFLIQWRKNNPDAPPRAAYDADGFDAAFNAEDNVVKEWTRAKDELALRAKTSITQALRDNGYDGVILENDKGSWGRSTDAYIALDANQVKNTTNKTPTADPDIRYQQRDSDKTGDWDENGNPIFDNTPVRVEEATDFAEVKRRRKAAVEDYGLEKNESMRIESYVSGLAYELNKRMNSGILSEQDQNYADKVRDAFRKFPQYKGTTFRNLSFGSKKAFEEFLLEHKKGEVIKLKAFTSTPKSPNGYKVSGEFIVHMEFRGESNADISETYGLPRQQEVVYMPETEIRVSDVTTANDGNPFIIVEEVGIRDQRANIGAEKPAGGMESNSESGRNFTGG